MDMSSSLVAALCVAVSFMLASYSCASEQESLQQYGKSAVEQPQLTLPRRLKLQEVADVKSSAQKDIMVQQQKKLLEGEGSAAGEEKVEKEENVMRARKRGTWREWVESPNKSDYFTMDYSWVRRRRPIHNKRIPFVP